LNVIYDHIIVIGEANFQGASLLTLEVVHCPYNLPLLEIAVCEAKVIVFVLATCCEPLGGHLIQRFEVMDVAKAELVTGLREIGETDLVNLHRELERNLHKLCSQILWQSVLHSKCQLELLELMPSHESRIDLDRKHLKASL
jgi:hypothetical protein